MLRSLAGPLLAACLLLGTASAGVPTETVITDEDVCKITLTPNALPIECRLGSSAGIDVTDCTESNCTLTMEATSIGTSGVPGLLSVQTIVAINDGLSASICIGPKAVSDALPFPCLRICESRDVGTESTCSATFQKEFSLPRGSCKFIDAISIYHYDWELADATTSLGWQACRSLNDRITITAFG